MFVALRGSQRALPKLQPIALLSTGFRRVAVGPPAARDLSREKISMFKITALITMLALGSSGSIAMASPSRTADRRTGINYTRVPNSHFDDTRFARFGSGLMDARVSFDRFDRFDRFDGLDRRYGSRAMDDFGPRRYRPTWVALSAPHQLARGTACIDVRDHGTFTQLRLQSDRGSAWVDRVIVQFGDGSDQVADLDRVLDQHGEFVEIPLDGNNRRIDRIIVTGATGDLQVFAI